MKPWAKLPTWWYRDNERGLHCLRGGAQAGTSQSALRVTLGLAAIDVRDSDFSLTASLSQIQEATGLSRPMVIRGITRAGELGFIEVTRGTFTHASKYLLRCPEAEAGKAGGWAAMPRPEVLRRLPHIPHRGVGGLVAIKIYMTLLAARPNHSNACPLRHTTLRDKTGAQPRDIRKAITMLGNEGLIDVNYEDPAVRWGADSDQGREAQRYFIRGNLATPRKGSTAPSPRGEGSASQF